MSGPTFWTPTDIPSGEGPYQVMPPLTEEEYAELKEDIRRRGIQVPIEVDEAGTPIDGHYGLKAYHELRAEGVALPDYPRIIRAGMTDDEKRSHARRLNLTRRHLSSAARRELVSAELREHPEHSDRSIADNLGGQVDHKTVAAVRREL